MNAITLYRFGQWSFQRKIPLIPALVRYLIFLLYNSCIPPGASIGRGTRFAYGGIGVVIHARARIGDGCVIGQGVTIGASEAFVTRKLLKAPTIGNNCYIATGAKILGNIRIGDNCIVGAGAIVLRDMPDNSVIVGCPAKAIKSTPPDYQAICD